MDTRSDHRRENLIGNLSFEAAMQMRNRRAELPSGPEQNMLDNRPYISVQSDLTPSRTRLGIRGESI